jgi:hypothetical protein
MNKVITDRTFSESSLSPPQNEEELSHTRSGPKSVNQSHTYREEYTFIHSEEIDNEYDNKDHEKRPP